MENIKKIAEKIVEAGGRLYLVGGAVRDKILNNENHDEDYCVVGLLSEDFQKLFPEAFIRGKAFEVFDLYGKEFAMARKEIKTGRKHSDFKIETNENITIYDDLKRRDLTINAIAQDVLSGEIIDPYGGFQDIKNKIIRATSNAFLEDPLRVYRVARFSSKLEFEVEKKTINMIHDLREELQFLSAERVFDEFRKALSTRKPSLFFEVLKKADVLDVHFKEIYDLIGSIQPKKYHPEGDSYNHTMLAVDKASEITDKLEIRFGALVHDLGKGTTPKDMYPHHYGHDERGVELVQKFGNRLKMPSIWIKCGKVAAKEHMKGGIFDKMTPAKKVSFLEQISKSALGLDGLEIVVEADRNCRGNKEEKIFFSQIGKKMIEEINGKYIEEKYNIKPSIKLKEKLHEERVLWMKEFEKEEKSSN